MILLAGGVTNGQYYLPVRVVATMFCVKMVMVTPPPSVVMVVMVALVVILFGFRLFISHLIPQSTQIIN